MALIVGLGGLSVEAAQRGDDRAAGLLREAVEFLVRDASDVEARQKKRDRDADRQAERRASRATRVESRESGDSPGFSPTPPFPTPKEIHDTQPAREPDGEMIERLSALLAKQMGEEFAEADAFVKRRPVSTWLGWLREMVKLVAGGSQFLPCDLAQVCRDDAALTRPVGSPYGLRTFLRGAVEERQRPQAARIGGTDGGQRRDTAPSAPAPRRLSGQDEAQRVVAAIRDLVVVEQKPGQPNPSRFIPIDKVKAMGPRVLSAYQKAGGAGRFMSCPAEDVVWLVRDVANYLEEQRATA
jgi:hypothetical protein